MNAALVLLLFQASAWAIAPRLVTVGDTTYLTRRFATTPDVWARLRPLEPTLELEPLVPPRWAYSEGQLTIIYVIAAFEPGRRALEMPDIELVYADGRVRTIVGDTAWIEVVSVLPAEDSAVAPMPLQEPVERRRTTLIPVIGLVSTVIAGLIAWIVLRRRRGWSPPIDEPDEPDEGPPIDVWVASGESRAVAAVMADRLREAIAERVPEAGKHLHTEDCIQAVLDSEHGEVARRVADVLRALERARFSPATPGDVLEVVDLAEVTISTLRSDPVES